MSLESSLWKWLKADWDMLPRDEVHYTRIENSASAGAPDVEGFYKYGTQFWVELKVVKRPGDPSGVIKVDHLRPKQVEWLHNRWFVGGRAFVLLRMYGGGRPIAHYLMPGGYALELYRGMHEVWLKEVSIVSPDTQPIQLLQAAAHDRRVPKIG